MMAEYPSACICGTGLWSKSFPHGWSRSSLTLILPFSKLMEPFFDGKTAIIRNTSAIADNIKDEKDMNCVILTYFGETSDDNWVTVKRPPNYQPPKDVVK